MTTKTLTRDNAKTLRAERGVTSTEDFTELEQADPTTGKLADVLEQSLASDDPAGVAAAKLEEFHLTPGAESLIARAVDNIIKQPVSMALDPDARAIAESRRALLTAADGNVEALIEALTVSSNVLDAAGIVYGHLYNILKGCAWTANMDYRRALDPQADVDLRPYLTPSDVERALGQQEFEADMRSEPQHSQDAPWGFDTLNETQLKALRALYGDEVADDEVALGVIMRSLEDVRLYFSLVVESLGWPTDRPMPYTNVQRPDGGFEPITNVEAALDQIEIKRKEGQAKRRERQVNVATQAASALAKIMERRASKR